MRLSIKLSTLLLVGHLIGCSEPQADLSEPKTHRTNAYRFHYPKNWKITEESTSSPIHYLFVETPGDALVVIQSYPIDSADDLLTFAKDFSASATVETPIGKITQSPFSEITTDSGYQWVSEKFSIELLGESVPHDRLYGTRSIGSRQVYLVFQVASEDLAKAKPGFDLITDSLRPNKDAETDNKDSPAAIRLEN